MNPFQRKANSVEMNSNDHRDAKGGLRRLRRPQLLTYAALLAIVAAIPVAAGAASGPSIGTPTGLQNFSLRLHDARTAAGAAVPSFSRTPSFAWTPVRGATRYEFELSTAKRFGSDNSLIWSSRTLTTPAAAVPISLPWITGNQSSLYWRVRAYGAGGAVSSWSEPRGFNMRWADNSGNVGIPQKLSSEPGYIRWTAIEGATGYDVWYWNLGKEGDFNVGKIFSTITTVADEREYNTLRAPSQDVQWRVRARRQLYGKTSNGLPRVSYGPWSKIYSTQAGDSAPTSRLAAPLRTVSTQVVSDARSVRAHALMPVFEWSRDSYPLHRVYIATDKDCVNIVHVGSIVGGTAYAPRVTGPLALDSETWDSTKSFLVDGSEGKTLRSDGEEVKSNETLPEADAAAGASGTSGSSTTSDKVQGTPAVDLWDTDWDSGQYYWTVVPVVKRAAESTDTKSTDQTATKTASGEYQDLILPQDACQAGNVQMFKKRSTTQRLGQGAPYVTGLSPSGRLMSAAGSRSSFYGVPLIAWTPSTGATTYDVEWSKTSYPWQKAGGVQTPATSALLPLKPGTWYYRVRGNNPWLPGNKKLRWSGPVRVEIAKPTFSVVGG